MNKQLYSVPELAYFGGKTLDEVRELIWDKGYKPLVASKFLSEREGWSMPLYDKSILNELIA